MADCILSCREKTAFGPPPAVEVPYLLPLFEMGQCTFYPHSTVCPSTLQTAGRTAICFYGPLCPPFANAVSTAMESL